MKDFVIGCDSGCAAVNHCAVGGIACKECGHYYCSDDVDENGLCKYCAVESMEVDE